MVLAPTSTVRPAVALDPIAQITLNRERPAAPGVRSRPASLGSAGTPLEGKRPAMLRATPMPRLSPTPARASSRPRLLDGSHEAPPRRRAHLDQRYLLMAYRDQRYLLMAYRGVKWASINDQGG
jgi:hypothetical protein